MSETFYICALDISPSPDDIQFVSKQLDAYNRLYAEDYHHQPVTVYVRDAENAIMGGLVGSTFWGWLHIDILWVHENIRAQGYGFALLAMAEAEASKRDCHSSHVETHSFQSLAFYEKAGYSIFGELDDFPPGHTKYFLRKNLG